MRLTCFATGLLFLFSFSACGGPESDDSAANDERAGDSSSNPSSNSGSNTGTDSTEGNSSDNGSTSGSAAKESSAEVVRLVGNSIEFGGERLTRPEDLAHKVSQVQRNDGRKADPSVSLTIECRGSTTAGYLGEVVRQLQLSGFMNMALLADSGPITIPQPATNSTDQAILILRIRLPAMADGGPVGMQTYVGDETRLMVESASIEHITESLGKFLDELLAEKTEDSENDYASFEIEIEPVEELSAEAFVGICATVQEFIESNSDTTLSIRLWPLGYPRETAPEIDLNGIPGIELQPDLPLESFDSPTEIQPRR